MNTDNLFSFAATAQLVINPHTDALFSANQEACRLFFCDAEWLQSQRVSYLFGPCFDQMLVFTQELIHKGRGWSDQLLITTPEGERRVELTGRCVQAGDDHWVYLNLQCLEEIDHLRKNSEANQHYLSGIGHWGRVSRVFQEFERENRLILEAAGEGIYGLDADGITTFLNPAAQRILGYKTEELAGRSMHSSVHHSHADGSHFDKVNCPIYSAFRDGQVKTVDNDVFWSKEGKPIDVEYTSTPIQDHGVTVGAVVVFRDVSQKKADEKRLRDALAEVKQLKHRLELENAYLQEEISSSFNHQRLIGKSPGLANIIEKIEMVASTDATVLINGESGTGKELIARAIHESSERKSRSLIRVNCAAIPDELFESEFFGHSKGAFTGAVADRAGRFELADGGTLFLDEVGEIPLYLQGKLLRVLQERQFERVGESKTRTVDVRIIAATNRDLRLLAQEDKFRQDLYFRLNVFPIESLPLRQRKEDIPMLAQHFLNTVAKRVNKAELKIPLSQLDKLVNYDWPGNIRELENVIERQVILAKNNQVRFDGLSNDNEHSSMDDLNVVGVLTDEQMRSREIKNIINALKHCQGRVFGKNGAAALLEIKATTLTSRIKKLKIDTLSFKPANSDV